ncbi:MAG: hypothetical protein HZA90_16380 [Verrucomicrobia bacterium]|nr:hypothetical protein [Verrucomicrobiota bacterium]
MQDKASNSQRAWRQTADESDEHDPQGKATIKAGNTDVSCRIIRAALPKALFVALTGTPLMAGEERAKDVLDSACRVPTTNRFTSKSAWGCLSTSTRVALSETRAFARPRECRIGAKMGCVQLAE